jgi:hypothetical protein
MKKIAILNGPNLDRLGKREPEVYGRATLADLEQALRAEFGAVAQLEFFQSNHEGALVDRIGALADAKIDGLVLNGGALTHTSIALRDALRGRGPSGRRGAHLEPPSPRGVPSRVVHRAGLPRLDHRPRAGGLPRGDSFPAQALNGGGSPLARLPHPAAV